MHAKKSENRSNSVDKTTPDISIIVPVYNVEKYVRKCFNSLLRQTYGQIEVIGIDDGSTDSSGDIIDEYEKDEYPIIKIIHTENRGLSAARNRGIDEARAEWIMFVDSDDWVDDDFCRIPYEAAKENQADLVVFQTHNVSRYGRIKEKVYKGPVGIVSEMIAQEYGGTAVWRKLYRKKLFDDVRYPEGRVFEDIATTHILVHNAQKIFILPNCLYYHVNRRDSITHTQSEKNKEDGLIAAWERYNFLSSHGFTSERIYSLLYGAAISYLSSVVQSDKEIFKMAKDIIDAIDGIPQYLSIKQKIALISWKTNKRVFYYLSRLNGRI